MQDIACPICGSPATYQELAEASWLPPAAIMLLEARHQGWQVGQGACPTCVRQALVETVMAQGSIPHQERVMAAGPHPPEVAFGVLSTPLRLPADPRYSGRGVTMALVDAGFYPHPDLVTPRNRIRAWADASTDPVKWVQFTEEQTPEWPSWDSAGASQWHGLMTSCVAAGNGWLSHGIYRGLACESDVVLVQARGADGRIGNENIARALNWLHEHGQDLGVQVVSISVAGEQADWMSGNPVDEAVGTLVRDGITVVAAAGNDGTRRLVPPATAPSTLTIGGLDDKNNFDPRETAVWHSNYGVTVTGMSKPELVAPSIWVVAPVLPGSDVAEEAQQLFEVRSQHRDEVEQRIAELKLVTPYYQHVDGTSFAAPIVASAVACMLEANPALAPYQIREILTRTAQPVEGADQLRQGAGAIEAALAVAVALRAEGGPMFGVPLSPAVEASSVMFLLYDPRANHVNVLGSWNEWSEPGIQAQQIRPNIWCAQLDGLEPGAYAYRFLLDGNRWLYDPDNPRKTHNGTGGFDSILEIGQAAAA